MAWPFDNQVDSVLPIDYGVQKLADYANDAMGNNRNLKTWPRYDRNNTSALLPNNQNISGQLRGYNNYDGAQEYNEDYGKSFLGVGRFDPRNLRPPDNLTQDLGASTYRGPQLNPLDSNWQHQLRLQEMRENAPVQEEQTGILENLKNKFSGFTTPTMEFLKKIGGQRSDAKQAEWDALRNVTDQYGTYRTGTLPSGQYADIVDNKITVTAPDGTILLRDKNFDSAFGSGSVAEMLQKKEDWAKGRFDKFGDDWTDDEHKGISKDLYNYYKSTGAIDKWRGQPSQTITEKTITDNIVPGRGQSDRAKIEAYTGRPMSAYRASRPASERQFTGHGRSGMGRDPSDRMAYGGRAGYAFGRGPVLDENINVEGPGFDINENVMMASAPDPMDALNDMSMNIFGKPLNLLNEEEYQMLIDMANDQASMGQDEGIASLV